MEETKENLNQVTETESREVPEEKVEESTKTETKASSETLDEKERAREGYAQRKLRTATEEIANLKEKVANMERELTIKEAMSQFNLSDQDVDLIKDSDPQKIFEKAEKLASRLRISEEKIKEKVEAAKPDFSRKRASMDVEGTTPKERFRNMKQKLLNEN